MKKTTLPQGLHDKLFKRARATYEIERAISDLLMAKGFNRIETPTLEHVEVFSDKIEPHHYHLFDKNGDLLALRPDITSQVGRVIASTRVHTPVKFSYSGKVFRFQEAMRGLQNESTQAGVEIVGYPAEDALKEAVLAAKSALDVANVCQYSFEFSHAAILQTIFQELALSEEDLKDLSSRIKEKHITRLYEFTKEHPSEFDSFIQRLPYLFGESGLVLEEARRLVVHPTILEALDQIEALLLAVQEDLPAVQLDLAQLSGMPYYTGIMFKVFDQTLPDAFVSGGRYDQLFERFGAKELTAVGWAVDIDAVYQAIRDQLPDQEGGEHV